MSDLSKASYILVPITNDDARKNYNETISQNDGYWCAPVNGAAIGDEVWFYKSKADITSNTNAMISRGVIIRMHEVGSDEQREMAKR